MITNIVAKQDPPVYSAFDPYCPTSFGCVTFNVNDHFVSIPTYDKYAHYVDVDGKSITLDIKNRDLVAKFISKIWTLQSADDSLLPRVIKQALG